MNLLNIFLISSIYFCLPCIADSEYKIKSIEFDDSGFPEKILVVLTVDSIEEIVVDQIVVGSEVNDSRGVKDLKKRNGENGVRVYEFLVDFSGYDEGALIFLNPQENWDFFKLAGPTMKINDSSGFVCLVRSKSWNAGFRIGDTNNNEFIEKWTPKK